jgi:membrane glycosyltransferase
MIVGMYMPTLICSQILSVLVSPISSAQLVGKKKKKKSPHPIFPLKLKSEFEQVSRWWVD